MQDMLGEFLARSFDAFARQQAMYQEQMRLAMADTPLSTFQKLADENLKAWQSLQDAFLYTKDKPEE
jgi:polyhydroxyalkanoate synthesis regulator protein